MAEIEPLAGKRMVGFFRLLKNAATEDAQVVPLEGDASLSLKRDSKSTTTKSGNIATSSALTTEIDQSFYEGISKVSDEFYDAILNNETVEYWLVDLDRVNTEGKHWAIYARARVTEDKPSFKADGTAERSPKMTVIGEPRRGYTSLSNYDEDMLAYAFRGVGAVGESPKDDGTDGNGTAYEKVDSTKDTVPDTTSKKSTENQPTTKDDGGTVNAN